MENYIEFFGKNEEVNKKPCTNDIEGVFDFLDIFQKEGLTSRLLVIIH